MILSFFVVIALSSCDGLRFADVGDEMDPGKETKGGELLLSFKGDKRFGPGEYWVSERVTPVQYMPLLAPRAYPDSNNFILKVRRSSGGEYLYNGKYGERPASMLLPAGNYDVEVCSRVFCSPEFDAPCYYDSGTVVIEEGKSASLTFLCRQNNCAVKLGFSLQFRSRFSEYIPEIEDSTGSLEYPYTETRYLYLNPGEITLRLTGTSSSTTGETIFITGKRLSAGEMLSINLHSSSGGGSGSGGDDGNGNSYLTAGIIIDTSSVWISDDITVGDVRDGKSADSAFLIEEIGGKVGAKGVWVSGYVVGYLTTASLLNTPPFETDTNIAIATKRGESNRSFCAGVSLPAGTIRTALNLKLNPENLGKRVWIKGTITESYFGLRGVNNVTDYLIE